MTMQAATNIGTVIVFRLRLRLLRLLHLRSLNAPSTTTVGTKLTAQRPAVAKAHASIVHHSTLLSGWDGGVSAPETGSAGNSRQILLRISPWSLSGDFLHFLSPIFPCWISGLQACMYNGPRSRPAGQRQSLVFRVFLCERA